MRLELPQYFKITCDGSSEYHFAEKKFYAGNISRLSLTNEAKPATLTLTISPVKPIYFNYLITFFSDPLIRNSGLFELDRERILEVNPTLEFMLAENRFVYLKEPLKINEENIGSNGVLKDLVIYLKESYEVIPPPSVIIPSSRNVGFVRLLAATQNEYN